MKLRLPNTKKSRSAATPARRRLSGGDRPQTDASSAPSYKQSSTFRRNKTITGSQSDAVTTAGGARAQLQSPRAEAHSLRRKRRSFSTMLLLTVVCLVVLTGFTYQFTASAKLGLYGQVGSLDTEQQAAYKTLLSDYYSRYPLDRFRFNLDRDRLTTYMQTTGRPEVRSVVAVQPDGFGATYMAIKAREPIASWTVDGVRQYVDGEGVIFRKNFYDSPKVTIVDESGVRSKDVATVASSRFLQFVGRTVGLLDDDGLTVNKVVIPAATTRQVQFSLKDIGRIKMTVDRPAGEQAEDAARAVRFVRKDNIKTAYLDVRVSGKAYYK